MTAILVISRDLSAEMYVYRARGDAKSWPLKLDTKMQNAKSGMMKVHL